MASSKPKLLLITLLLLILVGIATVFLVLRMTKLREHPGNNGNVTSEASFRIDSNSLTPPDNQDVYFIEVSPSTPTTSTNIATSSSPPDLDHCRRASTNLSKIKCSQKPPSNLDREWIHPSKDHPDLTSIHSIIHYDLDLTINRKDENVFEGSVKIFLKTAKATNTVVLHANRQISDIDERISVFRCSNGAQICVHSVTRFIDHQLLVLALSEEVPEGTLIVVEISHFESVIPNNQGLYVQKPMAFEQGRSWMIGTLFEKIGIKTVFPGIDEKESRASLDLCLIYPSDTTAKGNMPIKSSEAMTDLTKSCFMETPPIPSFQYGFVIFDNMHEVPSPDNSTQVEIFIGKHLKNSDSQWIFNEIKTVFEKMTVLTGIPFSAPKLTVISSFINAEGTHSLGLIVLKEEWIEYPTFVMTHTNVVRQVVQQWVSSILTVCAENSHFCVQEGLATYLEWVITEESKSINLTSKTRFNEARILALATKAEKTRLRQNQGTAFSEAAECAERPAMVFYIIEKIVGKTAMERFMRNIFELYGGKTCASVEEIGEALRQASNSDIPKNIFLSYARSASYPVIRINHLSNGHLTISQESQQLNTTERFTVPIDILDDTLKNSQVILDKSPIQVHKPSRFLVVDPEGHSYQRTLYNVESYSNVAYCARQGASCPIQPKSLKNIFSDMCWALMENKLETVKSKIPAWHQVFGELIKLGTSYFENDCSCCMRKSSETISNQCKWIWKDKCSGLFLANKA
ncbi:hypothetical protein FO519_005003 [Halicephalobus sp. NKZ332]|nr:hypothetical protein FO519_005003 [Halicephalobus sp. NKZ332]